MSFLDADSFTRSWSFLPIFNELDNDPHRSRNTIAHAQQAYQRSLFRESTFQRSLGEGAVFKVSLYLHNTRGQLYAVKKAKLGHSDKSSNSGKKNSSAGIFAAFKEIQVVSHAQLKRHPNVVDIIGWDWADDQAPVVFVEYSAPGSLQQFLLSSAKVGPGVRRNLALDIACGLHGLHSSDVAHGDVKLANTLVFPDPCRGWKAKISDFSHAIFGISLRRRSSYPGSGLYNAPEVRKRDAIIVSDRLPCCETFSFGLLVWEILLQGKPFSTCLPLYKPLHSVEPSEPNIYLENQKENELLSVALNSISCAQELSITERSTFHQVLSMTLKDQPGRRHDMQLVTSALDHTDRAVTLKFSSGMAMRTIAVWDFNAWDDIPWRAREEFVAEIQSLVNGPVQPNHAELQYLLSRCYSEGYGVHVDIEEAVKHLYLAAQQDSVEASCFIEMCQPYLSSLQRPRKLRLASNILSQTLEKFKREKARICGYRSNPSNIASKTGLENFEPTGYTRLWNLQDRAFVRSQSFTWRIGDTDKMYEWSDYGIKTLLADATEVGMLMCDVTISYRTILTPLNTATFYEVCASYGDYSWLQLALQTIKLPQDYENTSWGRQQEVWERLLNKAAQWGHYSLLKELLKTVLEAQAAGLWEDQWTSATGESPLHYLSFLEGDDDEIISTIKSLVKLGINIDIPITTRSWLGPYSLEAHGTPLQMAVRCQCLRVVKALADCGADLTLSFGDSEPPLALAVSLHCPEMVSLLLKSTKLNKNELTYALSKIGAPSKKGWYERVMRMSGSGLSKPPLEHYLAQTSRMLCRPNFGSRSEVSEDILFRMDGAALIEAINRGQKDYEMLLAMIQLGFGPSSMQGIFNLLKTVLRRSPDDPFRETLLDLIFLKTQHLAEKYSFLTLRLQEWHSFFGKFRYNEDNSSERTILHFLVINCDLNSVRFMQKNFPQEFSYFSDLPDSTGLSPIELAIDQQSLELYRMLTTGVTRDKRKDVERATEKDYNILLPRLLADEAKQEEFSRLERIRTMMNLFNFDSLSNEYFLHGVVGDFQSRETSVEKTQKKYEAKLQIAAALEDLGYFIEKKLIQINNVIDSTFTERSRAEHHTTHRTKLAETLKDLVGWVDSIGISPTDSSQIQKAEDLYVMGMHIRLSETTSEEGMAEVFRKSRRLPLPLRLRYRSLNFPKQSYTQEFMSDPATTYALCQFRLSHLRGRSPEWIEMTVYGPMGRPVNGPHAILEWIRSGLFHKQAQGIWREDKTEMMETSPVSNRFYNFYHDFMTMHV